EEVVRPSKGRTGEAAPSSRSRRRYGRRSRDPPCGSATDASGPACYDPHARRAYHSIDCFRVNPDIMTRPVGTVSLILLVLLSGTALANYPERPLRVIVPYVAGGSTDTTTRIVGARLSERLGQQVVVDNRSGGG